MPSTFSRRYSALDELPNLLVVVMSSCGTPAKKASTSASRAIPTNTSSLPALSTLTRTIALAQSPKPSGPGSPRSILSDVSA